MQKVEDLFEFVQPLTRDISEREREILIVLPYSSYISAVLYINRHTVWTLMFRIRATGDLTINNRDKGPEPFICVMVMFLNPFFGRNNFTGFYDFGHP